MEPCYTCAKILINAGVIKYICRKRYHGAKRSREIFKEAGIELLVLEDDLETYPDMK
jgi:dCMP deaminase